MRHARLRRKRNSTHLFLDDGLPYQLNEDGGCPDEHNGVEDEDPTARHQEGCTHHHQVNEVQQLNKQPLLADCL